MRGRGVEVVIELFDVFAVVTLAIGEDEKSFFQECVAAVPECERQAQPPAVVTDPGETVFAPAIGPATGLVVRQVVPSIAVGAIVFANRAPLPLRYIGSPKSPRLLVAVGGFEAELLGRFCAVRHSERFQATGDSARE